MIIDYQLLPKLALQPGDTWDYVEVAQDADMVVITTALAAKAGVPAGTEMKMLIGNRWHNVGSSTPVPRGDMKFKVLHPPGRLPHKCCTGLLTQKEPAEPLIWWCKYALPCKISDDLYLL